MSVQDYLCKQVHDIERRYESMLAAFERFESGNEADLKEVREEVDRIIIDLLDV